MDTNSCCGCGGWVVWDLFCDVCAERLHPPEPPAGQGLAPADPKLEHGDEPLHDLNTCAICDGLEEQWWVENVWIPTCAICDGEGHGYPVAGPCPLTERSSR